ncbi:hypothetical protein CmeUKMEL1_10060 [Cryptosporidium meleagridis]|uniref:Uncharacterized protein n=1 Tax=Cryptosporidium meleagridis TaxID=93969 RepID=A0A2P4Z1S0_9CRYT|nr:hypothetical protein CmeUKMEL1_10060 [Cryptosporidium meleagridis]
MDINDVSATVKTAFCNTQIAEAFAAAVVASSKGKEDIIQESYDLEIKKLSNELNALKNCINDMQQSFLIKFGAGSNSKKTFEVNDSSMCEENNTTGEEFLNREWETMQKYIYEHFKNQTEIQSKIKEIEDHIIHGKENFSLKSIEIHSLEKNLEVSTEHITTLAHLIENQKDKINLLEEKLGLLESRINHLDDRFITNFQILENVAKSTDSLMNMLNSQTKSWENSRKIFKKLSSDADYLLKKTADTFEENSIVDELALLLKKFIDVLQDV